MAGSRPCGGSAARLFGKESLPKDERRDGVPFFFVVLAVVGAIVEWFTPHDPVAVALHSFTFGLLFGQAAFALPVLMVLFAIWLFRHPSSVHDNGRIGIGLTILLVSVSSLWHIFSGAPDPTDGMPGMAAAGGILGWILAAPLSLVITPVGATVIAIVLLVLSLFIITKTPPNRLVPRLKELYAYLFGVQQADETAHDDASATKSKAKAKGKASSDEPSKVQFGSLDDLDLDEEAEPAALPWWRRNSEPARRRPGVRQPGHRAGAG